VACFLGSAQLTPGVEADARSGKYRLVYVTPEKFTTASFMADMGVLHTAGDLLFVAVDEAHCGSAWSHDFRPAFARIGDFRISCPACP
jgi:superfamily II DNA helicase RecQ